MPRSDGYTLAGRLPPLLERRIRMKNEIIIHVRSFPALVHDHRTGQEGPITVTVTREQLRAAKIVGQSSDELIERLCDRQGYTVIEIGRPTRRTVTLDLDELLERCDQERDERNKWNFLYGDGVEERIVD